MNKSTAYHEAGHAVVSYRLGFYSDKITIESNDANGTAGSYTGEAEWGDGSRDANYIVSLFAGYAAEKRHNPSADAAGAAGDNEKAAELLKCHSELTEADLRQWAEMLVIQHWDEIAAVATALVENTTLDAEEWETICDAIEEAGDWRQELKTYRGMRALFSKHKNK